VAGPGIRNLALGELTHDDLRSMLAEGETLFVEHKKDIAKGEGFQLAKAAASFANTLGGWVLIGVRNGKPLDDWTPPPGDLVDTVRQRMEGQVDPLPSFAAAVLRLDERGIGVVRVYESAATPHILRDGSVVVREPARDSKLRKLGAYEAAPIRSHYELLQLAQRGRDARRAAEERFEEARLPLVDDMLQIRWTTAASSGLTFRVVHADTPALIVRLAPLTVTRRWAEWAISSTAVDGLTDAAVHLLGESAQSATPQPFARGLAAGAIERHAQEWTAGGSRSVSRSATVVADAAGLMGARVGFRLHEGSGALYYQRRLGNGRELAEAMHNALTQLAGVLVGAEHIGRYAAHVFWFRIGDLYRVDPKLPNEGRYPSPIPLGGEITIGGAGDEAEHRAQCNVWAAEVLRSCGVQAWG
jgi:Putative DNA-binding domain